MEMTAVTQRINELKSLYFALKRETQAQSVYPVPSHMEA